MSEERQSRIVGAREAKAMRDKFSPALGEFWRAKEAIGDVDRLLDRLKTEVPWAVKKWDAFYTLPQKAYYYGEGDRKMKPIPLLEQLESRVAQAFGCTIIPATWCNLFEHGDHFIEWHQDQYGAHLIVLSFGAPRTVRYRRHKSKEAVQTLRVTHGDAYYMSPKYDYENDHCVEREPQCKVPRISLLFSISEPTVIPTACI